MHHVSGCKNNMGILNSGAEPNDKIGVKIVRKYILKSGRQ